MAGKLIVIEVIDGAGGQTQSNLLFDFLKSKKIPVEKLSYPDYGSPTGKFIDQYLHSEHELSVDVLFLLHTTDRVKDKEKINLFLREGKTVITDRWFTSTLAYQTAQGFDMKKAVDVGNILDIPKPDLVIYIKISPEISMKRKFGEKGYLDRMEKDGKFLGKVVKQYDYLAKNNVFGKWIVIDGEKTKEQVFAEIKKSVKL